MYVCGGLVEEFEEEKKYPDAIFTYHISIFVESIYQFTSNIWKGLIDYP